MVKDNVQCFREFGWNIAREMPVNGSPTDAFRMERICRRIRKKGRKTKFERSWMGRRGIGESLVIQCFEKVRFPSSDETSP